MENSEESKQIVLNPYLLNQVKQYCKRNELSIIEAANIVFIVWECHKKHIEITVPVVEEALEGELAYRKHQLAIEELVEAHSGYTDYSELNQVYELLWLSL